LYVHYFFLFLSLNGDLTTVRRAFQRCIQISLESPEPICEEFILFERHYGKKSIVIL